MRADVAHAARLSGSRRIGPPSGIRTGLQFRSVGQPALGIFYVYFPDFPEYAVCNSFPSLFDGRIARVGMRERQRAARFADFLPQPIGFVKTVCHRLVEHDVETPVERGHSRLEMEKVGRYDRYEVHSHAFGQRGFALDHLAERGVDPLVG